MPSLVSIPEFKTYLGLDTADISRDAQYGQVLSAMDAVVREYCNRDFNQQSYTQFYNGNGTRFLPLRQRPILLAGLTAWIDFQGYGGQNPDGAFPASSQIVLGKDYMLDLDTSDALSSRSGILIRIGTNWSEMGRVYFPGKLTADVGPAYGNIKVTYTAGYASLPEDLRFAICQLAAFAIRNVKAGAPLHTEKLGAYAYELAPRRIDLLPELSTTRQILARYKECSFPGFGSV